MPKIYIKDLINKIYRFFTTHTAPTFLVLFTLLISLRNYDPGTFLTGWDTLHPEFNFANYWPRIIDGVWQEHQGLGAVATQAHASEIPRVLIMQFLSLFMYLNQLRYAYAFLMLIIGPLGVYFFLKKIILKNLYPRSRELGAFAGALVYLLNLGTLQHFYVPLEMFLTHFGFIGWVMLYACRYFEDGLRKHLWIFFILSFFMIPQAHTPTLFYAYIINFSAFFGILVLVDLLKDVWTKFRNKAPWNLTASNTSLMRLVTLVIYTLLLNSFWLGPNLYFAATHGTEIKQSKIHHLFSEEAFLQNKEFGNIEDVAIVKNFLFNWGEHVGRGEFGDLMDEWKLHLSDDLISGIGYAVFGVIVAGIVLSMLKRERYTLASLSVFVLCMFFLFNVNPPLGFLFVFLQQAFPIFREAFRFPFTKFSIMLMLSYGIFASYFIAHFTAIISKIMKSNFFDYFLYAIFYSITLFSLSLYMRPALNGYLISPSMRVKIPDRYFEMFSYLDRQNEYGRVANLPIQSFWGWVYYNWDPFTKLGYQGAGFLWFGIKQPLMDREFDRWNLVNEQYYREMTTAVYSEDVDMFNETLEKYKIRWVLVDESVFVPAANEKVLFADEIEKMLGKSSQIALEKDFGKGLKLYKYTPQEDFTLVDKTTDFVYSDDSLFKENTDPLYNQYGTYVSAGGRNYPYLGITSFEESLLPQYVSSDDENIYFTNRLTFARLRAEEVNDYAQFDISVKLSDTTGVDILFESVPGFLKNSSYEINLPYASNASDESLVLMVDQNPIHINISELNAERYLPFGHVSINPSKPLEIDLLSAQSLVSKEVDYSTLLEKCSGIGDKSSYVLEFEEDGFKIYATDINACVTMRLDEWASFENVENLLIEIAFDLEDLGAQPLVCLLDSRTGLCVNTPLENGRTLARVDVSEIDKYFLRFTAGGILQQEELGVGFSNLVVNTFSEAYRGFYDISYLAKVEGEYFGELVFKKDPGYSGLIGDLNFDPKICNTGYRNFDKSFAEIRGNYIHYESRGESLCDTYQFPFANHQTGYILELRARNVEGVPLRICLTNEYSKRCDVYVSLGTDKDFTTHYYLVPSMGEGSGYTVNISNTVFGEGTSINDLEYVSLTPFQYTFLRSLHGSIFKSNGETLITYNQSFEKGWIALCGLGLCDAQHVMVNNWANGWLLDNDVNPEDVKIVFWPQLLEYFGFVLAVSAAISIKKI